MDLPLNAWLLFENASSHAAHAELVSRHPDGSIDRLSYRELSARTHQLIGALDLLGVPPGATVATLAWNSSRHLEAYFAVPMSGRVLHTLNLRLSPEELAFIISDADDVCVLVDPDLLPLLESALALISTRPQIVVLACELPSGTSCSATAYEPLLAKLPRSISNVRSRNSNSVKQRLNNSTLLLSPGQKSTPRGNPA